MAIAALVGFFLFLHKTKLGTGCGPSATIATPPRWASRATRLRAHLRDRLALAAVGVVAAPITTVEFRGGVDILPFCFMAVIIGGLGNLPGTAAAAVLLAFMEGVQSFADPTVARIASLVLMSAVLLLRPQGLFKGLTR